MYSIHLRWRMPTGDMQKHMVVNMHDLYYYSSTVRGTCQHTLQKLTKLQYTSLQEKSLSGIMKYSNCQCIKTAKNKVFLVIIIQVIRSSYNVAQPLFLKKKKSTGYQLRVSAVDLDVCTLVECSFPTITNHTKSKSKNKKNKKIKNKNQTSA